tara:strand:- start:44 stop:622 length:579 start_codon:yes stop_codon:yes gene_type:complete
VVVKNYNYRAGMLCQTLLEPAELNIGKLPAMVILFDIGAQNAIQQDHTMTFGINHFVDIPSLGKFIAPEDRDEGLTLIMVADSDMARDRQFFDQAFEPVIGLDCALKSKIRQITRKNAEICICVARVNRLDPVFKTPKRVQPMGVFAFIYKVKVTQNNKFQHNKLLLHNGLPAIYDCCVTGEERFTKVSLGT